MYVGRYAPSPTGDLHLGNARTALIAWLWARRTDGRFLLRFEDLDAGRVRPGCAREQADALAWLGLDWDDEPVVQSERGHLYAAALEKLSARGLVYECFCSRADVRRAASAPHGPDGPVYGGTCRDLTSRERERRRALGREPALRVRMQGTVEFHDDLVGCRREILEQDAGDIVVRRSDGVVAYQLAVVVDDAAQGVTHVVRGADLLHSTARQLRLYRLLGLEPVPGHAHVPLLLGPDGARLSKRHGAVGLAELRAQGAHPAAIIGRLAHSAGLLDEPHPCAPAELVERFDPGTLAHDDVRIDPRW
ncbi:MAG TPA: tRNA glutamyl-Q(34) synthetase GluQRS [Solirubrobacteraceae bacterium]|nr:tRNA glutamyl-Q(34) synthetase GluQRS [Solirubrobacteraceae bacterium]